MAGFDQLLAPAGRPAGSNDRTWMTLLLLSAMLRMTGVEFRSMLTALPLLLRKLSLSRVGLAPAMRRPASPELLRVLLVRVRSEARRVGKEGGSRAAA